MTTDIRTQLARLGEDANTYVALTPGGDVLTAWQDGNGDWHAIRPISEDDAAWDELPEHVRRSLAVVADGDPDTADVDRILWTDLDSRALADVAAERRTHHGRGWTAQYDDEHGSNRLIELAWRYAYRVHPTIPGAYDRAGLVKAASLLVAAIDTLDRAEADRA